MGMANIDEIKLKVKEMNESADVKYYASSEGFVYFKNNSWAATTILELCDEIELVRNTYNIEKQELLNKIESAKIENLKKQVEDLKLELDEARDPVHCNLCGSCGIDMCCPAHGCAHPHIKSETLKEQSETILELYNELKEKDEVLAWYGEEGVYNWHYSDDKRTTTTTDVQEDFGKRAREVIQKYKASEG